MDTLSAFVLGQENRHKELMVFDWMKAAEIIKERRAQNASAGLAGDWEWTGGDILENGMPVPQENTYTYLASTWATPQLDVDGDVMNCYLMARETPGWGAKTYWPQEALDILESIGA